MKIVRAILVVSLLAYWAGLALEYREYKIAKAYSEDEAAAYVQLTLQHDSAKGDGWTHVTVVFQNPPPPLTNVFWFYKQR